MSPPPLERFREALGQRRARDERTFVTVVSGLPRSGTSLLMQALEAGGIPPLTDKLREADKDNPKGYYEFERVKKLDKGDKAWVPEARGKAVKVISALLRHLPPDHTYKVVFMRRHLDEVLASQKKMLVRRGEPTDAASDEELKQLFEKHLAHIEAWVRGAPYVQLLYVSYNELMADPRKQISRINGFLGGALNEEKMAQVVDPELYRNRANP